MVNRNEFMDLDSFFENQISVQFFNVIRKIICKKTFLWLNSSVFEIFLFEGNDKH